jgi:hypothetical protein
VLGKIAADISSANMERSRTTAFGMCFDDHTYLLFNSGWGTARELGFGEDRQVQK